MRAKQPKQRDPVPLPQAPAVGVASGTPLTATVLNPVRKRQRTPGPLYASPGRTLPARNARAAKPLGSPAPDPPDPDAPPPIPCLAATPATTPIRSHCVSGSVILRPPLSVAWSPRQRPTKSRPTSPARHWHRRPRPPLRHAVTPLPVALVVGIRNRLEPTSDTSHSRTVLQAPLLVNDSNTQSEDHPVRKVGKTN